MYDVSDERARDESWFAPIYRDLDEGGGSEFLYLLQNLKLGDWHPRQLIKTTETIEQQRMSADSVSQWALACINADAIVGAGRGPHGGDVTHDLGTSIPLKALHEAYTGFCRQSCLHPVDTISFGKACTEMFGKNKRLPASQSNATGNGKRRPWGYRVPKGDKWREKVDARLGIKN